MLLVHIFCITSITIQNLTNIANLLENAVFYTILIFLHQVNKLSITQLYTIITWFPALLHGTVEGDAAVRIITSSGVMVPPSGVT